MGDLAGMMEKMQQMQEKMEQSQREMAATLSTAEAAGGLVKATVNGHLLLERLVLDKSRIDLNDIELLEDAIIAAVAAAQSRSAENMKKRFEAIAKESGLPPEMLQP